MSHPVVHFRLIPSIEQLRQREHVRALEARYGREAIVEALREEAAALRQRLTAWPAASGTPDASIVDTEQAAEQIERALQDRLRHAFESPLRSVINATGVIVHTNLGRAPLAASAAHRVAEIATGYSNLEYDLEAGRRGARDVHAEALLCRLTGAEAALVFNNNAAAVLIMLSALAAGREVIISRGELVEIGGGFRIPDVMLQSGALLREVGTTNKTRAADYSAAISERSAVILRIHPSNFRIDGFTERPALKDLVSIGHRFKVPVCEDLGSGNLLDWRPQARGRGPEAGGQGPGAGALGSGMDEPLVRSSIDTGAGVVCFSGDKLLGGPQAGIIVGRRDLLGPIRKHPLMRALRVDKMTYAALDATLLEYARGRATETVPVARMLSLSAADIERRARAVAEPLQTSTRVRAAIVDGVSTIGGGSAPGAAIPTRLLSVSVGTERPDTLEARLRRYTPPIIARIEHDRLLLDLRTVLPEQDQVLAEALLTLGESGE